MACTKTRIKAFIKDFKILNGNEQSLEVIYDWFINPFFEIYKNEAPGDSYDSYRSYIQNIFPKGYNVEANEKYYDCIVPLLFALSLNDEAISLMTTTYVEAVVGVSSLNKNKKTAITRFVIYVLDIINKKIKIPGNGKDVDTAINIIKSSTELVNSLKTLSSKSKTNSRSIKHTDGHELFLKDDVIAIMMGRLKRQDRMSGDKVWLPLGLISKIYNPTGSKKASDNPYNDWIRDIAENIFIHYIGDRQKIKCSQLKDLVFLLFYQRGDAKEVYAVKSRGGQSIEIVRVLTPIGELNKKCESKVASINGLAIDHVRPIDLTLRDLGESPGLPALSLVSKVMKDELADLKKQKRKATYSEKCNSAYRRLVNKVWENRFENFKNRLIYDLISISNDSPCRLMDANNNLSKSNLMTYKYFKKYKGFFYGIIYGDNKNETCVDDNQNNFIICHRLDTPGLMIYTKNDDVIKQINKKQRIPINEMDLNLI